MSRPSLYRLRNPGKYKANLEKDRQKKLGKRQNLRKEGWKALRRALDERNKISRRYQQRLRGKLCDEGKKVGVRRLENAGVKFLSYLLSSGYFPIGMV